MTEPGMDPFLVPDDPGLLISAALAHQDRLTDWERGFVQSVADQFHAQRRLSDKQIDYLRRAVKRVRGML